MFELTGLTAVVTGGGRGIGRSICLSLARAGANIVVAEINPETGQKTAEETEKLGRRSLSVKTDVRRKDDVRSMFEKAVDVFGSIDILVNNAGGADPMEMAPPLSLTEESWDSIIRLNLKSVFLCSQAAAEIMIGQHRGVIINVASLSGVFHFTQGMHYGAAKAGVINMTRTLAACLGPKNIRVNALVPGFIVTDYTNELTYDHHEDMAALRSRFVALQRLGEPDDVGGVAVFLASEAARYITGQAIMIDGGFPHFPEIVPGSE
ncbi:MAG: glucose 1-dehydrogenase [Proteobacteria bacterium]|nr:glucose 1-dehydrogenase [Pseudomonadota bacterium]